MQECVEEWRKVAFLFHSSLCCLFHSFILRLPGLQAWSVLPWSLSLCWAFLGMFPLAAEVVHKLCWEYYFLKKFRILFRTFSWASLLLVLCNWDEYRWSCDQCHIKFWGSKLPLKYRSFLIAGLYELAGAYLRDLYCLKECETLTHHEYNYGFKL